MGTDAFAEALGKTLDQFLTAQSTARASFEKSNRAAVAALGLPSRDQVVGISRQLMDLEDRLEALEDQLARLAKGSDASSTRKPPRKQPSRKRKAPPNKPAEGGA